MEPHQFYETLPDGRWKFRVDHHLLDDFNTCDRLFQFRHMPDPAGLVWATKGVSVKVAIGSWWATFCERYYDQFRLGQLPTEANIVEIVADAWTEHEMERYRNGTEGDKENFEKFGGAEGALQMAVEYHRAFGEQHFRDWQVVATELGFGLKDEIKLGEDLHVVVYYTGRPDLVVLDRAQQMVMPLDFKTKDLVPWNAPSIVKPLPQLCGYIFATRKLMRDCFVGTMNGSGAKLPTKCIVMFCARLKPSDKPRDGVKKPRFLPVYANYSLEELEEWRLGVIEKCRRLRSAIERAVFLPRESACHLYAGCMFRRVCSMSANVRPAMLQADFVKQAPWQPYELQED